MLLGVNLLSREGYSQTGDRMPIDVSLAGCVARIIGFSLPFDPRLTGSKEEFYWPVIMRRSSQIHFMLRRETYSSSKDYERKLLLEPIMAAAKIHLLAAANGAHRIFL